MKQELQNKPSSFSAFEIIVFSARREISVFKTVLLIVALWTGMQGTIAATAPTITSFTPATGIIGATITINGTGFNTAAASNVVYFGATKATVTGTPTATKLTVTVPKGATYNYITEINIGSGINLSCRSLTKFLPTNGTATSPFYSGSFDANVALTLPSTSGGTASTGASSIAVGDIDGDGKPDLVFLSNNNGLLAVYRNTSSSGSISFAAAVTFATASSPQAVSLADIDGDGKLDIVLVNSSGGTTGLSIFRNNASSGSFTTSSLNSRVDFTTGSSPEALAIGDIDGDGKLDIVVSNFSSNTISLFKNAATSGSITTSSLAAKFDLSTSPGSEPQYLTIGDVDGDSKPDIVLGFSNTNALYVYHNKATSGSAFGAATLSAPVTSLTFVNPTSGNWNLADIDGDGKLDIAGVDPLGGGPLSIFRNTNSTSGTISFGSVVKYTNSVNQSKTWGMDIGDLDGDGKPDVGLSAANEIEVYRNTATSGTISTSSLSSDILFPTSATVPSSPRGSMVIVDLDGDGKPDMVTGYLGTSTAFIFHSAQHTLVANSITGGPFCSGSSFNIGFTSTGTFSGVTTQYPKGNGYIVQLSTCCHLFTAGNTIVLDTIFSTASSGTLTATIPALSNLGTGTYDVRIVSTLPALISDTVAISIISPAGYGNQRVCTNEVDSGTVTFTVNDPGAGITVQWSTDGLTNNDGSMAGGSGGASNSKTVGPNDTITEYASLVTSGCTSGWVKAIGIGDAVPNPTGLVNQSICGDSGYATFTVNDPGAAFGVWEIYFDPMGIEHSALYPGGNGTILMMDSLNPIPVQTYAGSPDTFYVYVSDPFCPTGANTADDPASYAAFSTIATATAYTTISPPLGLSNQTVCGNGSVTFSVNDPGAGLSVDWTTDTTTVNDGVVSGGSGPVTITKSVTVGSPVTEYARIDLGCGTGSWVSATGTANICSSTWIGVTDTSWFTDSNWTSGLAPNDCSADVVIQSGTPFSPVISGISPSVGNISINAGVTLSIQGQTLSVCGNWSGGSGSNAAVTGSGMVLLNNSSATGQTISGNTQFNILQVNNGQGVSLQSGASISIATGLHLQAGMLDVSAGTLHLLSTASNNNSYIDDFTGGFTGNINGNVIADRYVPTIGFNQHFISSPVSTPLFSQLNANGPDGSYIRPTTNCDEYQSASGTPYGAVFQYNDGHAQSGQCMMGNWEVRSAGNLDNARGYSTYLTGNSTLSLTGTANRGYIKIDNLNNSGFPTVATLQGHPIESGWNLVGNPYPSAIDLTVSRDTNGFQNQVQIWKTSGPFEGSWQPAMITGESGQVVIPPFQAFMVRIDSGSIGSHYYPFYQSERTRTANLNFYRGATENSLELDLACKGVTDITTVRFKPEATNTFDNEYDANKPDGGQGRPTLYTSMNDNHWYSLNSLPNLTQAATVPVGLKPEVSGTMTLTPQGIESFDPTTYIYLEDKQTNTWQNLRSGAYTFNTNATDNQDRFVLHFTPPAQILTGDASCSSAGIINITQPGSANWNYQLTDNNSTLINSGTLNAGNPLSVSVISGVYSLTLQDNTGYTVIKNIQVGGSQPVVAAFTPSVNTAQPQDNIVFASSTDNATAYTWNFGDGSTASGQTVNHSYQTEGVYNVTLNVTSSTGCTSTATQSITVTPRSATGINTINGEGKINIWSNENRIYVDFSKQSKVDAQIEIYNVIGQLLSSERFGKSTLYSKPIDNLEAAYMIVRVKNEDEVITQKVFISSVK